MKIRLAFCLFLLVLPTSRGVAADKKPTIGVAKTESQGVAYWQPAMGDGLAQMFITEFVNLPNFTVLETVALDDIRAERHLGETGEVSEKESVKKGQFLGADYTFKSVITRFGSKANTYGGGAGPARIPFGLGGFAVKKDENEVQIDWRIIDNATRAMVPGAAGRAVGVETGTSFNFSSWGGHGFNNNREFMDSALGKATMKAIAQIVEKLKVLDVGPGGRTINAANEAAAASAALRNVKGSVKLVEGKEVWISLGANNGFAKGDKIKVYKPVEKKNKKGEVIATSYELATEIILEKVQKDKSMGRNTGTAEVNEDWAAAEASVDIEKLD